MSNWPETRMVGLSGIARSWLSRTRNFAPPTQELDMSTDYVPLKKIRFADLIDGRLESRNVCEHFVPSETTDLRRCLTDGGYYLWVYIDSEGFVGCITRYGGNAPGFILNAIADTFDTEIVSEYQPEFWGFATNEEWEAAQREIAAHCEREFEINLLKYLRGEPNGIRPGTIGMVKAEIGRILVERNPNLMSVSLRSELMALITAIERDPSLSRLVRNGWCG
jgi:hypothetical protein